MSRYYRSFLEESGAVYTARTTAFASATAITDTTILNALNTFDLGLISNGLDTKMKALYPFVGTTATTQKFNFMDARDLDIAFRLQFNGGWTHSTTGALPNGTNAYGNTYLSPLSNLTNNNTHICIYSRTATTALERDLSVFDNGDNPCLSIGSNSNIITSDAYNYNTNRINASVSNTLGLILNSRINSTTQYLFKNSTLLATNTNANTINLPSNVLILSAANVGALGGINPSSYSAKQVAFSSIGSGLNTTETSIFYNLVQALQTALSRQV